MQNLGIKKSIQTKIWSKIKINWNINITLGIYIVVKYYKN